MHKKNLPNLFLGEEKKSNKHDHANREYQKDVSREEEGK